MRVFSTPAVVLAALLGGTIAAFTPSRAETQAQASSQEPQPASPAAGTHTVTVTFNYDFSRTPSCTSKPAKRCVEQFNVYEVSSGNKRRTKLFSIPAKPGETKMVTGITGKSPQLPLDPGKHQLAVTAQMAGGSESAVEASTTWVVVPSSDNKSAIPVN